MNLQSLSRKLVVLAFVATLLVGLAGVVSAQVTIDHRPDIILIGDEEPVGKPGHGMISIMDTIMVRVTLTPGDPDSIDQVVVDLRKYGGDEMTVLGTYQGRDAYISNIAWVPVCSVTGEGTMMVQIVNEKSIYCPTDTWTVCWHQTHWDIIGLSTGDIGVYPAVGDTAYYVASGDTIFMLAVTETLGICCNSLCNDCDHFEFETHQFIPPDTVWTDTLVVSDADSFWIDNTPCDYIGHDDPTVLVTAYMTNGYTDTCWSNPPVDIFDNPVDYDTHWTTYIVQWPRLYPVEFQEDLDYYFGFDTDNAGWGYVFGAFDNILNPVSCLSPTCDVCSVYVDTRKLAHENGNDDILFFAWDAHLFGGAYADTNWWHVGNPYYGGIICTEPVSNGVTDIFSYPFCIQPDSTDVPAGEELPMIWISDSGDTTWFGTTTNRLLAIDNQIPGWNDPAVADSVMPWDIMFDAEMTNAGSPNHLNPASEGYPVADWLKVRVDLAGLFDLDDVMDGGRAFASMMYAGYYMGSDYVNPPLDHMVEMFPESPIYATPETDIVACPPSPYCWDQDSIFSYVHVFDNAGNGFCLGAWDTTFAIDNQLPVVDSTDCLTDMVIWTEISEDVAFKTGYANVGMPEQNIHGNEYVDRDRIVLHADLGDYFGVDEIIDVVLIDNPYCNNPVPFLYDDGLNGGDPVMGDKNYTGHTRIQVAGSDSGICILDTDELEQTFEVLVTDDAGNAAINSSCYGKKVDNEPPWMTPENVSIMFWDDPETFGVDGDKDGDGMVTVGDELIFEWRAQDEVIEDGEIDSVRVNLGSIDSCYSGWQNLYWRPPGGIYRNWWPDTGPPGGRPPGAALFTVTPGCVDGEELCADFKVWDNAGNTNGWQTFCSGMTLDNVSAMIDCAEFDITVSGEDDVAAVGDTIFFYYDGTETDVAKMAVYIGDLSSSDSLWLEETASWEGYFVVEEGDIDDGAYMFDVTVWDEVGNYFTCQAGPVAVDNMIPTLECSNVLLRLFDYVNMVPYRVVNVGDNLTAGYWDADGDVVKVTADYSNYGTQIGTDGVVNLVPEFDGGALYYWGYRVDPVPAGDIDQPAGGLGTMVLFEVWDDAGNYNSMWVCPKRIQLGRTPDPIMNNPADGNLICNSECVAVDNIPPDPVPEDAITFELLESSNNIANVGDRLKIVVDMGDPSQPGYDMEWEYGYVQADIHQYGHDYEDLGSYLFLTDRAFSAGGEGDGRFSFHFYDEDAGTPDGQTLIDGIPILPDDTQLPAEDAGTRIRVRAMDDAGNFSLTWTYSDALKHSVTGEYVPVDNQIPEIDPSDIGFSYVDNDENGICDIGDEITITVDMTDAPGGGVTGVWANLFDWGYPSMDKVPLTAASPVYSITFTAVRNPGNFCADDVLIEDVGCGRDLELLQQPGPFHPEVEVVAQDESDNWSAYEWVGPPYTGPFIPQIWPEIEDWPFMPDWSTTGPMDHIVADTDAPDPLNPTYQFNGSDIRAYSLVDGAIGLKFFYERDDRNQDVQRFFVYSDATSEEVGEIDWDTYLGEPIPVGDVPQDYMGMFLRTFVWVSDYLPEREDPYHFAVLAVDNAGNFSDPELTWITGDYADATSPSGFVKGFSPMDQPTDIGGEDAYFLAYLNSDYYEILYNEWWARIKDLDPNTEGDQPGEWKLIDEDGSWPQTFPYNPIEAPYHCYASFLDCATMNNGHPEECFDLISGECYTFEVCMIPWDTEGNHITPDEAEKFVFTYDNWGPVLTYWSIDGHPSPAAEHWLVAGEIPIVARGHDGCDMNGELTWELWLLEVHGSGTEIILDQQTLAEGEDYNFMLDLSQYPAGGFELGLLARDEAGNIASYTQYLEITDTYAPGGRFAFWKMPAILFGHFSHPEYLKIVDGMGLRCDSEYPMTFWVQWPGDIPAYMYDVGQVEISYTMTEGIDEWIHVATLTGWQDSLTFDGSLWFGYDFAWDTSIFDNGDAITMHAEVMDEVGNTMSEDVDVVMDCGAPVLAIDVPEAMDVCGEMRVKGPFNVTATETTEPVDTYFALWAYKSSDFADIGDCNPFDDHGWRFPIDSLMILDLTTPETIWRATIDPATEGMEDGSYDIVILTEDVDGNMSWDQNGDYCIDPGYWAWAQANGMGMTIVVDNEAPEVRIRTVQTDDHTFEPVDQGWLWPMLPYAQCDDQVTVSCWTESDCDVAEVSYWLIGSKITGGMQYMGASSDESDDYMVTFPSDGEICDYLLPGALSGGHVTVSLVAKLTDVLGSESFYYIDFTMLDIEPASAFMIKPLNDNWVSGLTALQSTAINSDVLYDVTYEYRASGSSDDWTFIAKTRPNDGIPWNTDLNGNTIYWNTAAVPDGDYDLHAVARDANLTLDPDPTYITVHVDNVIDDVVIEPYGAGTRDIGGTFWLGGTEVTLSIDSNYPERIECVTYYYKDATADFEDKIQIGPEICAPPFGKLWADCAEGPSFCDVMSGMYELIAKIETKSGVEGYVQKTVYVDHWAPEASITEVADAYNTYGTVGSDPCCCYDVWGLVTFTGWGEDNVPESSVANIKLDSGIVGAQFQYMPYDPSGCDGYLGVTLMGEVDGGDWINLGDVIMDTGPNYTQTWDMGMLTPGYYAVRVVGVDLLGNRADSYCGYGYEPSYVCIHVTDMVPPTAVIAGVDDITGYIWACYETHGQDDVAFVRFEYSGDDGGAWTPIGEVDGHDCHGAFGVPWHFASLSGSYWVRAVAYDDDYDPIDHPDLYDKNPAKMMVTIADGKVTMASTDMITGLDRWGNLEMCDQVTYSIQSDEKPCVIGVFDNDPMDDFNLPWAQWRNQLINPDDPTVWVDHFDISEVDPYGTLTLIATYNDDGIVGAVMDRINLYKVSAREGTRGAVSQDGMSVDIPAGALDSYDLDGLLIIQVPELIADPSIDDVKPVGGAVMMTMLDHGDCDHYHFENGNRAHLCMGYDENLIPMGYAEQDLRIAFWDQGSREWIVEGSANRTVDIENNQVCVYVDQTGTYSVVAAKPIRISTPIFDPRCPVDTGEGTDMFTGPNPQFCSIVEDLGAGYIDEIMVVLNGPVGDPIYDNMIIYHGGCEGEPVLKSSNQADGWFDYDIYGAGWYGSYNFISNTLCMKLIPEDMWEAYWDYWYGYEDWFLFYGDRISDGLPAGSYTLDIYAQNEAGDEAHVVNYFNVDAKAPKVDFKGKYVMSDPEFMAIITDDWSGVNTDAIYLDIFGVQPNDDIYGGNWVELEDYLGTATPSSIEFDETEDGYVVTFGDMAYGLTLSHGMSIDVIVYDGNYTTGSCEYGDCRQYMMNDGVADCAENHAKPVWRRFTVDDMSPTMEEISDESATEVEIKICDELAGVDASNFLVDGQPLSESDYDWTWTPLNAQCGILRIDVGDDAVDIDITAMDKAGNAATMEINKGSATGLDVAGWGVYPVPFDPAVEDVQLKFTLSNGAHVLCKIYDFAGLPVRTVADDWKDPGTHVLRWLGNDDSGNTVAPGAYIAYVKVDDGTKVVAKTLKIAVGGVSK